MRLWTWQSKDFSLFEKSQKVESIKHSFYVNKYPNLNIREKHREAYEKMFQKLDTNQLIWCFTNYIESIEKASIEEFEKIRHCLLWEIDIPDNEIIWYCNAAWNTLRTGKPAMPEGIWEIFHSSEYLFPEEAKRYENEFNIFWSGNAIEDLLNLVFLKKPVFDLGLPNARSTGCSGALVIHPVDIQKIIKNPFEIGRWWNGPTQKNWPINNDANILKIIPCLNCPGR